MYVCNVIVCVTFTDNFHADVRSCIAPAVAIVKVAKCIATSSALIQGFSAVAFTDRHGMLFVLRRRSRLGAAIEAEGLADSLGAIIIVPEVMTANGVVLSFKQHLRDKALSWHDLCTTLRSNKGSCDNQELCDIGSACNLKGGTKKNKWHRQSKHGGYECPKEHGSYECVRELVSKHTRRCRRLSRRRSRRRSHRCGRRACECNNTHSFTCRRWHWLDKFASKGMSALAS